MSDGRGQPPRIDTVVGRTKDGQPVTAFERIVELLKAGCYFETACAAAGVTRETAYEWRRRGARLYGDLAKGDVTRRQLGAHDKRCMAFSDAVALAEAEWEANANVLLEQIARGGLVEKVVTEKVDANGQLIERSERTAALLPDAKVLMNRLAQRFPERYRKRVELTGPDGAQLVDAERVASLLSLARAVDENPDAV